MQQTDPLPREIDALLRFRLRFEPMHAWAVLLAILCLFCFQCLAVVVNGLSQLILGFAIDEHDPRRVMAVGGQRVDGRARSTVYLANASAADVDTYVAWREQFHPE